MDGFAKAFCCDYLLSENKLTVPAGDLFQVSELSLVRNGEIAEHIQYCDEITYAISGKALFYSGDTCEEIHSGQIHFVKKGNAHKIVSSGDSNFRYICIGFSADPSCEIIKSFHEIREGENWFSKNDDGSVRRLTELLLNEFYMGDEEALTMINLYLCQLLVSVARIYKGSLSFMDKKGISGASNVVYNALRYIDREYIYITSVRSVAKELSYNEYYLSHIFSEKVGMNMKEYIIKKKLQGAAQMLCTTELSVGEIADYFNFSSHHTFRLAFKKNYSVSPTEYRKFQTI